MLDPTERMLNHKMIDLRKYMSECERVPSSKNESAQCEISKLKLTDMLMFKPNENMYKMHMDNMHYKYNDTNILFYSKWSNIFQHDSNDLNIIIFPKLRDFPKDYLTDQLNEFISDNNGLETYDEISFDPPNLLTIPVY